MSHLKQSGGQLGSLNFRHPARANSVEKNSHDWTNDEVASSCRLALLHHPSLQYSESFYFATGISTFPTRLIASASILASLSQNF